MLDYRHLYPVMLAALLAAVLTFYQAGYQPAGFLLKAQESPKSGVLSSKDLNGLKNLIERLKTMLTDVKDKIGDRGNDDLSKNINLLQKNFLPRLEEKLNGIKTDDKGNLTGKDQKNIGKVIDWFHKALNIFHKQLETAAKNNPKLVGPSNALSNLLGKSGEKINSNEIGQLGQGVVKVGHGLGIVFAVRKETEKPFGTVVYIITPTSNLTGLVDKKVEAKFEDCSENGDGTDDSNKAANVLLAFKPPGAVFGPPVPVPQQPPISPTPSGTGQTPSAGAGQGGSSSSPSRSWWGGVKNSLSSIAGQADINITAEFTILGFNGDGPLLLKTFKREGDKATLNRKLTYPSGSFTNGGPGLIYITRLCLDGKPLHLAILAFRVDAKAGDESPPVLQWEGLSLSASDLDKDLSVLYLTKDFKILALRDPEYIGSKKVTFKGLVEDDGLPYYKVDEIVKELSPTDRLLEGGVRTTDNKDLLALDGAPVIKDKVIGILLADGQVIPISSVIQALEELK